MYRESTFESNVKWFVVGIGGLSALCQIIMLFSEFKLFAGIGMLFNGLYHFIAVGCPALIIFLILKYIDDKEVYSNYALALQSALAAIVDICLVVKYILDTKDTEGLKVWIIVMAIILVLLESFNAFVFVRYALDKVTCMVPLLLTLITCIIKGTVYSQVDNKISTFNHTAIDGSFFSIWMFMHLLLYLAFLVCLLLYLDSGYFSDLISDPKNLFSSNTLFGTYTNLYSDEAQAKKERKNAEQIILSHNAQVSTNQQINKSSTQQINLNQQINESSVMQPNHSISTNNVTIPTDSGNTGTLVRKCPDCGNTVEVSIIVCNKCGCPLDSVEPINIDLVDKNIKGNCPDCGAAFYEGQNVCNKCGCPL